MNKAIGFPVTLRDEAAGTSRIVKIPLSPDDIFARVADQGLFDQQENPEPADIEVVGQFSEQAITLRFWSPLPAAEARRLVAAAVAEWEVSS